MQKHGSSNKDQKVKFTKAYSNNKRPYKKSKSKKQSKGKSKSKKQSKGTECFCIGYSFDKHGEQTVSVQSAFMSSLEIVLMKKTKFLGDSSNNLKDDLWKPDASTCIAPKALMNVKKDGKNDEYNVFVPIQLASCAVPQLSQFMIAPKLEQQLPPLERDGGNSGNGGGGACTKKEEIKKEEIH